MGDEETQQLNMSQSKKAIETAKRELKVLLKNPIEKNNHMKNNNINNSNSNSNGSSVMTNKTTKKVNSNRNVLQSHKRKGFVVFAK